jgi:GTPase SAR1 family protein
VFNFNRNNRSSRAKGGFWASAWSAGAFAALTSFTFSMAGIVYLTRDAIETNDEMILRACLASPLFLLAGVLCMGLMAKQAARYFADGYHASQAQPQQALPLANTAETIDAIARLVVQQQAQVVQVQAHQLGQGVPMLPMPTRNLMDALRNEECLLIWGQKGAGKTTVLLHLIRERLMRGHEVKVFDPHAFPNKWLSAQVVGLGREYEAIDRGLSGIVDLMTTRYQEIARGEVREGEHPHLTIIVDEFRSIVANVSDVAKDKSSDVLESRESVKTLLTEARKTNINIALISHSKGVKALGMKGEGDLREGLAVVHLIKDEHGQRRSEVSFSGDKPIEMALPGPFTAKSQYGATTSYQRPSPVPTSNQPHTSPIPAVSPPVPPKKEQSVEEVIEELRKRGKSETTIIRYLAKKYPKLSANAIFRLSNGIGRNRVLAIVKAVRNPETKQKEHTNGHVNGHKNGRLI